MSDETKRAMFYPPYPPDVSFTEYAGAWVDEVRAALPEVDPDYIGWTDLWDSDGYCVTCGCGNWRLGHAPWCVIANFVAARQDPRP